MRSRLIRHFSEKYPLLEMAEHCDAALIQAGQGTLYAMLMGKCPFVSIPGPFEQRHNITNLLENFGCAKRLYAAYLTSRQVAEAMHEVLTEPPCRSHGRKSARGARLDRLSGRLTLREVPHHQKNSLDYR